MSDCCKLATPEERDRNFADGIRARADQYAGTGNFAAARSLIAAAQTLLDNSGGHENESGLWLLASQANILQRNEEADRGVAFTRQALALAEKLFPAEHPAVAVCVANLGESLKESGDTDGARDYIARAVKLLEDAQPTGIYTQEYIDNILWAVRGMVQG